MTAKELMIGDLFESFVDKEVIKVESLTRNYPEVTYLNVSMPKGMVLQHDYKYIEPIPLTEEILEKNGWDTSPYSILKVCNDKWLEFYHHERRLRLWWKGIDEWQNHAEVQEVCFQCNCTYVHELQHALRLCGLNELADNFKL